jgi:putative spermidine/putrescine transport system substrate-binding protein
MERRRFLQALGLLSMEPLLFGCGSQATDQLRIQFLRGSLPLMLTKEFRQIVAQVEFQIFDQLADIDKKLQDWHYPKSTTSSWRMPWQAAPDPTPPDLVTLGNGWLPGAIEQQSIQPLAVEKLASWQQLDAKWRNLVTVNDKIWAAPYRWGSTVLIYRSDRLRQNGIAAPKDWADLWQPALRGKVVLLNQPQEVIGLTLKKLGHSYQTDPQQVPELLPQLQQLHRQALFYSSDTYLPPLLTGDAWVAVGWSSDLAEALKHNSELAVAVPLSGTSLWADLWVRPTKAKTTQVAMADRWIDFCWQSLATNKISTMTGSLPPHTPVQSAAKLDNLTPAVFDRGEFLPTLSSDRRRQYDALWKAMGVKTSS